MSLKDLEKAPATVWMDKSFFHLVVIYHFKYFYVYEQKYRHFKSYNRPNKKLIYIGEFQREDQ